MDCNKKKITKKLNTKLRIETSKEEVKKIKETERDNE
jgi:hypothetical protein